MKRLTLFLVVLLSLCATNSTFAQKATVSENFWYISTATRVLDANHEMLVTPLLADVEVCKDAEGKNIRLSETLVYWLDCDLSRQSRETWINELKKQALFDCAMAHNADILVGSLVSARTVDEDNDGDTDRDNNRYKVVITVSGYPALYTHFRNAVKSDYWIPECAGQSKTNAFNQVQPNISSEKNKTIITE